MNTNPKCRYVDFPYVSSVRIKEKLIRWYFCISLLSSIRRQAALPIFRFLTACIFISPHKAEQKLYSFIEELGFPSSSFFKDPFCLEEESRNFLSSMSVISGLLDLNAKLSSVFWVWVSTVPSKEGAQGNQFWGTVWEHHPASPISTLLGSAWIRRMGTTSRFQMLFSDRSDMRSRAELGSVDEKSLRGNIMAFWLHQFDKGHWRDQALSLWVGALIPKP